MKRIVDVHIFGFDEAFHLSDQRGIFQDQYVGVKNSRFGVAQVFLYLVLDRGNFPPGFGQS